MAFWDNESRLVKHICHSFVISDDTGYSDRIFIDDEDSIEETDQGYHINQRSMTGVGIMWVKHTHSITKTQLDQSIKDIENAAKSRSRQCVNIIKLTDSKHSPSFTSINFSKKVISHQKPFPSLLTRQISQLATEELPYFQFSKFDAKTTKDRRTSSVTIIFDESKKFLQVTANLNIRIFELIGLSLYLYHNNSIGKSITGSVDDFKLYIADENGDIDRDFPALDPSDFLKKFRFSHLGLVRVERNEPLKPQKDNDDKECVVIYYKLGDYPVEEKTITISRAAIDIQMIEVLSLAIRKKGLTPSESYILSDCGNSLSPILHNRLLSEFTNKKFWFLKLERSSESELFSNTTKHDKYFDHTIPQAFEHYEAYWLNKKSEPITQILINENQITFKPLILDSKQIQKSKFRLHPTLPKTESIDRNSVLRCEKMSRSPSIEGRKTFIIVALKGNEKKMYEFEAESLTVANIIESLSSKKELKK